MANGQEIWLDEETGRKFTKDIMDGHKKFYFINDWQMINIDYVVSILTRPDWENIQHQSPIY